MTGVERWNSIGLFLQLAAASTRITNVPAPVNVLIVGPPGDGKTKQVERIAHLPFAKHLSDATWMGVINHLQSVKAGQRSMLIVPDFASLVGRRYEVARATMSLLAMMCAEGVREMAIGKRVTDFGGAQGGVVGAITYEDLTNDYKVFNQNAFLSRVFLLEQDFSSEDKLLMRGMRRKGDESLLTPLPFPKTSEKVKVVTHPSYTRVAEDWWKEMLDHRSDRTFGFRTADAFDTMLKAAAFLRGARQVTKQDVATVGKVRHTWLTQFKFNPDRVG